MVRPDALNQAALMLGRKICWLEDFGNPLVPTWRRRPWAEPFYLLVGVPGQSQSMEGDGGQAGGAKPLVVDVFSAQSAPAMLEELLVKLPDYRAYLPGSLKTETMKTLSRWWFRRQFETGWSYALNAIQAQESKQVTVFLIWCAKTCKRLCFADCLY